jgi:hypothetical protein
LGGLISLKHEVSLGERNGVIQVYGEIGSRIAVDIAVDIGVGGAFDVTHLSGLAGEGRGAKVGEGLITERCGIRVDRRQVDPVTAGAREVEDRIAATHRHGRIGQRLEGKGIGTSAAHQIIGTSAPMQHVAAVAGVQDIVARATGHQVGIAIAEELVGVA